MPTGVYERKFTAIERFMNFVEIEPNTGCWLWTGYCGKNGRGLFLFNGKRIVNYRFSYEYFIGSVPDGLDILHKCDVCSCVNWEHLFLGTNLDNMNDMLLKGRGIKSGKGLPYGVQITPSGNYRARISFNGKRIALGSFPTIEEATRAVSKKNKQRKIHAI